MLYGAAAFYDIFGLLDCGFFEEVGEAVQRLMIERKNALCDFVYGQIGLIIKLLKLGMQLKKGAACDIPMEATQVLVIQFKIRQQLVELLSQLARQLFFYSN